MLDLSIIIPVYNTPQEDLRRCFDSLKALQGICWETLVVDDGSREETKTFCKHYCEENEGFLYFRKENGGVSSARNMGLENAHGRYVMFVDADDCLLADAFAPTQFQSDADLVIFDTDVIEKGNRTTWPGLEMPAGEVDRMSVLRRYLCSHALNGPYAKLFKTTLLQSHALRFDTSFVTAEDWLFGSSFALLAEKFQYISVSSYLYYRDGGNSLSRLKRFPDTMMENQIAMYNKKLQIIASEFAAEPDCSQLQAVAATAIIENLFNGAADLYLLKLQTPARKSRIMQICREACGYLLPASSRKTRMKSWILNHFWIGIYPIAYLRSAYLKLK